MNTRIQALLENRGGNYLLPFFWQHGESEAGEVAQVWLNETALGTRICRPYSFDVTECLRPGENTLRIEVTNTLVYAVKDDFSRFFAQDQSGLIGPVQLRMG